MNDTSPEMDRLFREMIMKKSGQERLRMGFSMFDMARRQVIASIKAANPEASEATIKKELFLRFYGRDFSEKDKEAILRGLSS